MRKKIPHFRLYIDDFLEGTRSMSAAEVGDYVRLLCVIYDQGTAIAPDPQQLRHVLKCRAADVSKRIWRLIELGKLFVDEDNRIHNGRADREIEKRQLWSGTKSLADNRRKNASLAATSAQLGLKLSANAPKTEAKSNGAVHSRARPDSGIDNLIGTEHYIREPSFNGSAATGASHGFQGRSAPAPPDDLSEEEIAAINARLNAPH